MSEELGAQGLYEGFRIVRNTMRPVAQTNLWLQPCCKEKSCMTVANTMQRWLVEQDGVGKQALVMGVWLHPSLHLISSCLQHGSSYASGYKDPSCSALLTIVLAVSTNERSFLWVFT